MNAEKINTLKTLVDTLNTVVDRLDTLADKQEELILSNKEAFRLAGEDYTRRIIEAEVEKHIQKDKKGRRLDSTRLGPPPGPSTYPKATEGPNGERKNISFNITQGSQGDNQ